MSALTARFDRWVDSGPFTAADLGVYRIVYAVVMLFSIPDFRWVDAFPDSLFTPPVGPFVLLTGFPPEGVMGAVGVMLAVALVLLAMGYLTTAASAATALLLLYGSGISYSLGKIDHTIFVVLVPAVLLFARWGDAVSIDALRRRRRVRTAPAGHGGAPAHQWPMRLLALLIGLGFFTAAFPKVISGWLDPRTQAVQAILGRQYFVNERTELLAPLALSMDVPLLWELADLFAVVIELVIIFTVPWWRAFRASLACLALFHLGVLLTMNIFFVNNVLVYGAFVSWSALRLGRGGARAADDQPARAHRASSLRRESDAARLLLPVLAVLVAVAGGWGVWALRQHVTLPSTSWPVMVVGAVVGVWYLVRQARRGVAVVRRGRTVVDLRARPEVPPPAVSLTSKAAAAGSRSSRDDASDRPGAPPAR